MSAVLPISELLRRYGDSEIQVQNLQNDTVEVTQDRRGALISFSTDPAIATNYQACLLTGDRTNKVGLVVWLDRDKADKIIAEAEEKT